MPTNISERKGTNMRAIAQDDSSTTFKFGNLPIRTAGTPDSPLFCAADVCAALGLGNASQACSRLKETQLTRITSNDSGGIPRTYVYVTEPGLYRLINSSRKPDAEAFQDWVAEEVLPAIRKTGGYLAKPLSIEELCVMQSQALLEQRRRLEAIDSSVSRLVERAERADAEVEQLNLLPPASSEAPPETEGQLTVQLLRAWGFSHGGAYQAAHRVWQLFSKVVVSGNVW